jgi:hypothetical protein
MKKEIFKSDAQNVSDIKGFIPDRDISVNKEWKNWKKRVCLAVPATGLVRIEWMMARFGQVIPCNWSNGDIFQFISQASPLGFEVAAARNICVEYSITQGFEWTLFIDHDVILPPDTFLKMNSYMRRDTIPIVSGLYFCKGSHPEPLIFRGRGNSYYGKWKSGDKVWVDGIPMGCTLIHNSLLKVMWKESKVITYDTLAGPVVAREVFETPRKAWFDPEQMRYFSESGTEDLFFCDRLKKENFFVKAGWKKYQTMKYPLLVDTSIFCRHISESGQQFP